MCFTSCSGLRWWTVQGCEQNQDQCTTTKMHCSPVKQWLVMVPSSPYHTLPYHTLLYLPHHTFPCPTITYHTLPYHTNLTTLQHGMAYRGNGNGSQQSQCLGTDLSLTPLPYISPPPTSSLHSPVKWTFCDFQSSIHTLFYTLRQSVWICNISFFGRGAAVNCFSGEAPCPICPGLPGRLLEGDPVTRFCISILFGGYFF